MFPLRPAPEPRHRAIDTSVPIEKIYLRPISDILSRRSPPEAANGANDSLKKALKLRPALEVPL